MQRIFLTEDSIYWAFRSICGLQPEKFNSLLRGNLIFLKQQPAGEICSPMHISNRILDADTASAMRQKVIKAVKRRVGSAKLLIDPKAHSSWDTLNAFLVRNGFPPLNYHWVYKVPDGPVPLNKKGKPKRQKKKRVSEIRVVAASFSPENIRSALERQRIPLIVHW